VHAGDAITSRLCWCMNLCLHLQVLQLCGWNVHLCGRLRARDMKEIDWHSTPSILGVACTCRWPQLSWQAMASLRHLRLL
jgi:hypothetical protein